MKEELIQVLEEVYNKGEDVSIYFESSPYGSDLTFLDYFAVVQKIEGVELLIICREGGGESVCGEIDPDFGVRKSIELVVNKFIKENEQRVQCIYV